MARVGERVACRGSVSEELGGLRAEYRHGLRGRRAQGRGGSVWRGGKGREGDKARSLVEEARWRELAREWQGAGVCLRGLEACGQSVDMAGEGGGRREGAGQCGEVGAPTCCFADASFLFLFYRSCLSLRKIAPRIPVSPVCGLLPLSMSALPLSQQRK